MEIEDYLKAKGFSDLLTEAKKQSGDNKTRVGRFVGDNMPLDKVPDLFIKLLDETISLASTKLFSGHFMERREPSLLYREVKNVGNEDATYSGWQIKTPQIGLCT